MILGSDSHTRYGALGTMAIGEGGGELVKQLLKDTYDVAYPGVIAVYLEKPAKRLGAATLKRHVEDLFGLHLYSGRR